MTRRLEPPATETLRREITGITFDARFGRRYKAAPARAVIRRERTANRASKVANASASSASERCGASGGRDERRARLRQRTRAPRLTRIVIHQQRYRAKSPAFARFTHDPSSMSFRLVRGPRQPDDPTTCVHSVSAKGLSVRSSTPSGRRSTASSMPGFQLRAERIESGSTICPLRESLVVSMAIHRQV